MHVAAQSHQPRERGLLFHTAGFRARFRFHPTEGRAAVSQHISLQRAIGLRGAVAVNVITMIGIGPLVTIPLVIAALGGPLALVGWIAGAIVALCDGLVWAELSSQYPGSGGTYVYLRAAFGDRTLGRALAFLFNWQFLLYAPCLLASGYIGFANYAGYLYPAVGSNLLVHDAVAVAIGILTIATLYRRTARVAALGSRARGGRHLDRRARCDCRA